MAVVQISKIQVRRGQKSTTGIPQLSSAEFAWAIDTQELFIGNGSVAEGAPYVGNTKILTEHDNILELASSYQFYDSDPAIVYSVPRTLQSKLDDYVSILDYGAIPDGSTDCVEAFERAFEDLFRNNDQKFKKPLYVPNGVYLMTQDLRIPSTAVIIGENRSRALIQMESHNVLFVTEAGEGIESGFDAGNRPQNITIKNLTFFRSTGQVVITGVKDSTFENVRFLGEYELGDTVDSILTRSASVSWENNVFDIAVSNNKFKDCIFEKTDLAIKCDQTDIFATSIVFDACEFKVCETGVYVDGIETQQTDWKFNDCKFEEIYSSAFESTHGRGTIFSRCDFFNCGNANNSASNPTSSIISFGESFGNIVKDCTSNRQQAAFVLSTVDPVPAIAEISNSNVTSFSNRVFADLSPSVGFKPLTVFSSVNRFTYIDYTVTLGSGLSKYTRIGRLTIVRSDDIIAGDDDNPPLPSFTDEYQYSPLTPSSSGGSIMTNFEFSINYADADTDSSLETMVLNYRNPFSTGESGTSGTITFSVSYGV